MKKFNEGDWFRLHKMTKDQQEWCLDNLDWLTEEGKYQCYYDKNVIAYYYDGSEKFGSSRRCMNSPSKELTFEDLYYDKESTKPTHSGKYSIEDLRRIRDNINGLLQVVDEINSQSEVQESEESVLGFEGLELTSLGRRLLENSALQKRSLLFKRNHSESQTKFVSSVFPNLIIVEENSHIAATFALKSGCKDYHFNDLFQYKKEG